MRAGSEIWYGILSCFLFVRRLIDLSNMENFAKGTWWLLTPDVGPNDRKPRVMQKYHIEKDRVGKPGLRCDSGEPRIGCKKINWRRWPGEPTPVNLMSFAGHTMGFKC